jgi:hypothetical protein
MTDDSSTTSDSSGKRGDGYGGKMPIFKGTKYSLWVIKFEAYVDDRGWYEALEYEEDAQLTDAQLKKNRLAFNCLCQCLNHDNSLKLVAKTQ